MRSPRLLLLSAVVLSFAACGGGASTPGKWQCDDGKDNDGDGLIDFPDDPGCTSAEDNTEDSQPAPQCKDGRDNDGDGKIDYPDDPGCFAANQDDESDDCPDGPNCPQCSNGKDDDMNGTTDYPADPGCTAASDMDEYTDNPQACGAGVMVNKLPGDGHVGNGMLSSATSKLSSTTCGGPGAEDVYELRVLTPKLIIATTDTGTTTADTVLYLRNAQCAMASSEVVCNDDISATDTNSAISYSVPAAGTYYLVVDTKSSAGGSYDLQVQFLTREGDACQSATECAPGLQCRIPSGGTVKVCAKHECEDGVDDDGDGKVDFPNDPGCASPSGDSETDPATLPVCGNGSDDDHDGQTDWPNDYGCASAAGTSEAFCSTEHDATAKITAKTTAGTTVGKTADEVPTSCATSSVAPDVVYALQLPVPVDTLTVDTLGSAYDTVLYIKDPQCGMELGCNDDDSGSSTLQSKITMTNVMAGSYAIVVDGYSSTTGTFTLNVQGTVAPGTDCTSPLFSGGATAVLLCPANTTCTAGKCQ